MFSRRPSISALVSLSVLIGMILVTSASSAQTQWRKSDPSGIEWAAKAMAALTGGVPINSATLTGTVVQPDNRYQSDLPITLRAASAVESEINITEPNGVRSVTRSLNQAGSPSGTWSDANNQQHAIALHNCWTDAAWFFPALTSLSLYGDPSFVFLDIGKEQRNGISVEHIQVYRRVVGSEAKSKLIAKLGTVDYYLEYGTAVPIAVTFSDHPNDDLRVNIPVEVDFSNFRLEGSRLVPFQIERLQNGTAIYRIAVITATLN